MFAGRTIRHLRLLKDFSQKGIARKLGISQAAYSKLEKRKKVEGLVLERILKIMRCSVSDLEHVERFEKNSKDI